MENEFPNDTNEEEQLTEGSEPYFPLPAFPQDDIWPELLEKIISYSKKTKQHNTLLPGGPLHADLRIRTEVKKAMKTYHQEKAAQTVHQARGPMSVDGRGNVSQELTPALYARTCV